jgi:hypothetical protein
MTGSLEQVPFNTSMATNTMVSGEWTYLMDSAWWSFKMEVSTMDSGTKALNMGRESLIIGVGTFMKASLLEARDMGMAYSPSKIKGCMRVSGLMTKWMDKESYNIKSELREFSK